MRPRTASTARCPCDCPSLRSYTARCGTSAIGAAPPAASAGMLKAAATKIVAGPRTKRSNMVAAIRTRSCCAPVSKDNPRDPVSQPSCHRACMRRRNQRRLRGLANKPGKLTVGQKYGLNVGRSSAMPVPRGSLVLQENIMAGAIEKKLTELGITISTPAAPVANYVGYVRTGNLLVISGQICLGSDGKLVAAGKLGAGVSIDDGQEAARACAINLLAQLKAALGDLDKVVRVVRLGGFINSAPSFLDGPKVMNGASDLMVAAFGDKGKHARSTVGVAALPADAAVEVEGLFEVS